MCIDMTLKKQILIKNLLLTSAKSFSICYSALSWQMSFENPGARARGYKKVKV